MNKVIDICEWPEVERLTRSGKMAGKVIEEIRKHLWNGYAFKTGIYLAFGGGSIVFDSPLKGILRMNTFCRDEDSPTGFAGEEHTKTVLKWEDLEDAVWSLLSEAFDDLCDVEEFLTEDELQDEILKGTLRQTLIELGTKYPKDTVFLEVLIGNRVSACWLGEGVIFVSDNFDMETIAAECKDSDSPEEIAEAIYEVILDTYKPDTKTTTPRFLS